MVESYFYLAGKMCVKGYQVVLCCMITCVFMGGFSHARTVSVSIDDLTQRITTYTQGQDNEHISDMYYHIKNQQIEHTHPLVRAHLRKVTLWMEDHFTYTRLAWTNSGTDNRKSGKKKFLTKTGDQFVVPEKEPFVANTASTNKKTVSPLRSNISSVSSEKKPVVTLPAIETDTTSREETQRYTLKHARINITQLTTTRLGWVNDFRKQEGVDSEITHQPLLDKTATQRSLKMRADGDRSHKRTPHSSFYDYHEIDQWFADRGLTFTNVNRATHTENVGLSTLRGCTQGDCTAAAEQSLRGVFDYFINEKGQAYDAHYRTIIQPYFREMGFGIAIDETTGVIYSTMHYATETKRR